MRNALARYNLNHPHTLGPRQCLIVALLADSKPLMASEIARAFTKGKPTSSRSNAVRQSCRRLITLGLVASDVSKAETTFDGFFYGERFKVTASGRALARRMQKITGLGNTFAVVRGWH